jgi:hypothetical protein
MWFCTNVGYGFYLGTYSKKFIKLNDKLKTEKSPFKLFALIPEIYNKIDLTKDAIRSLLNVYIGIEPRFRELTDIIAFGDMLKDYVKTSNITTYSQLNFFSGVDIERYYSLFDPLPSDLIINTEDDDLLILYDNLSI